MPEIDQNLAVSVCSRVRAGLFLAPMSLTSAKSRANSALSYGAGPFTGIWSGDFSVKGRTVAQ